VVALGARPRQKSAPAERSTITLASVAPAARTAVASSRRSATVGRLPCAALSMVTVATAPSWLDVMVAMAIPSKSETEVRALTEGP
jgi:hypothetical protein